jgi:geranylgeranyl pyrophosphate synthase
MNLTQFANGYPATAPTQQLEQPISALFSQEFIDEILELHSMPAPRLWEQKFLAPMISFFNTPGKSIRREFVKLGWTLANFEAKHQSYPQHKSPQQTNPQQTNPQQTNPQSKCPEKLFQIIEVLHSASLIVDDIEDDSFVRRGRPCLHRQIGLGPALNIANWLYFVSSFLIDTLDCSQRAKLNLHKVFNRVMLRCHQGQALDLSYRVNEVAREDMTGLVESSTRLKTGVLVGFAMQIAALYLDKTYEESLRLYEFGEEIGLALQMYDDLSGVSNPKRFHKAHEDFFKFRPTWIWLWLAENPNIDTDQYENLIKMLEQTHEDLSLQDTLNLNNVSTVEAYRDFRLALLPWLSLAPSFIEDRIDQALHKLQKQYALASKPYRTALKAVNKLKVSYL